MLDTIRLKIPIDENDAERIVKKSIEFSKEDHLNDLTLLRAFMTPMKLGSYDRHINIYISEANPNFAYLEFSLPKFKMGHNIFLFYPTDLEDTINEIYQYIRGFFNGRFPHWKTWEVVRLDICYAWKFKDESIAELILNSIKKFKYPRQQVFLYENSIMYKGVSYTSKWYLKNDEFYKHDFPKLLVEGKTEYAYTIENASRGVLRFEITLKKRGVEYYFLQKKKSAVFIEDLKTEIIMKLLQTFFKKYFNGFIPNYMRTQEVAEKLIKLFGRQKAKNIFQYYEAITSTDPQNYSNFKKFVPSPVTIRYYKRELIRAGVGVSSDELKLLEAQDLDFNIPSKYATS